MSDRSVNQATLRAFLVIVVLPLSFLVLLCTAVTLGDYIALRPLAAELGVSPQEDELVAHVEQLLEQKRGASQADVHQALESLGGSWTYRTHGVYWENRESAYWTMAELPFNGKVWAVFVLYYDEQDRLVDFAYSGL